MKTSQFRKILFVALALCLCLCVSFAEVLPAQEPTDAPTEQPNAPMVEVIGNLVAAGKVTGQSIGIDLYAAGETVAVDDCEIGAAALLAGRNINVTSTEIGGSLRAAGFSVNVSDTGIRNNATVAGYTIRFDQNTQMVGAYAAGNDVYFGGTCFDLRIAAQTATISGTVNGDANVYAERVIIEDGAVITGTLHVSANEQPVISSNASIGNVAFQQIVNETAQQHHTASPLLGKLWGGLYMVASRAVLAVLFYFVLRRTTRNAGDMITGRPVAMPVTGLVSLIAVPFAVLLLFITVIGVPAALLMMMMYGAILAFSVSFMGCAAGQRVFSRMHPLVASLIGVAVLSVAQLIPILGIIVTIGCMIYALGYFIQKIYLNFSHKRQTPESDEQ